MPFRIGLLLVLGALSAGCAGMSEQACLVSDWRTVGFEDGAAGRPVASIGNYRQQCAKHGVSPDLEAYRAGHAEGVETFCRPARGFDVGRRGGAYRGVCPSELEPEFVDAYEAGHRLYELESSVRSIDNRMASNESEQGRIKHELAEITATIASDETTSEDRVELVARAAELGSRYSDLSKENESLSKERVGRVAELEEYRQTLAYDF